ncbi:phage head-binding domain-containing protein [Citrobacter braakii]|uniref:phage head-binding domain-containing protein n=1 Tax=Citrobacter braakii TaxID=57706 RepID=UPI001F41520F|nr:phage head-binding domain-containing protein [Citrobacter braakii]
MSDITANIVVSMPSQLFTMPRSFKAVANGKIYISKIDTPPGEMTDPANSVQVYLENEDGSHVPVSQPIIINAGGFPVYNGQIAKFVTVEGHSMAVYDAYNTQLFYYPNILKYDPDQLRQQIENPDGATLYPELQVARWRDDGDARGWGVFPDGTDVTAKMCAWLDAVNGDYSKLVQYGQYRNRGYLPPGDYVVSSTNLTGNHALLGRMIIRCDMVWDGRVPNGEFTVLHVKGNHIRGLSCKNIIFQGVQHINVENIDTTGDVTLKGSTSSIPIPGLSTWGGGSYWNNFSRIKTGTTSGGGKLYINIYEGSVNQNTFTQVSGGGLVILGQGAGSGGGNYEGNANMFLGVDTSGSSDYLLDNQSVPAQLNYVHGLYGEVTGNGRVRGPWAIFGGRVQFNGWVSTMSHMTSALGLDPTAGQQGGETISLSSNNLCPSGDWSVLNGKGFPEDYSLLTIPGEALSFDDALEPGGAGRYFGVSNASVRCRIIANLTKTQSGYIRGAFFYRGDDPVEIVIEDQSGSNTIYMPIDKYTSMGTSNGWRLYRVSAPTNDKTKSYRLRITVDAGKTGLIGCSYFSSYNACILPTFCGWSKSIMRNSGTPIAPVTTTPIGFMCYRTSPASFPSDPVIAWQWNGLSWLKINASA